MATYSFQQLKDLWILYGGPPEVANVAAAIALGESGGRTDALANEPDGSVSRGLWQINSVHGAASSFDVATNARKAVALYKGRGNFSAWTVYNEGIYKQFLNGMPDVSTGGSGGTTGIGLELSNPLDALKDIADQLTNVIKAGEWFADAKNIVRIVQVVVGSALVVVGLVMLSSSLATKIAEPIVKTVGAVL